MPSTRPIPLTILLAVLLLPALAPAAAPPVVHNPDTPADGVRTLALEELWRRGGDDDQELMFGAIRRAVVDTDGVVFLLDSQLCEVMVLSPDGELVRTLGRQGDGPGEFRSPTDLCLMPDGTVAVTQMFPGRIVKLTRTGDPAGAITVGDPTQGAFYMARGLKRGGDTVVLGVAEQHVDQQAGRATRESFIGTFTEDGRRAVTFASRTSVIDHRDLCYDEVILGEGPDRRYAVAPSGDVVVAEPRNGYELKIYAPDGSLRRTFTRDYEPWVRDARARGIQERMLTTLRDRNAPHASIHFEDTEPDISSLRVADDGRIWVLTSRARWEPRSDALARYDVFTPDGRFAEQVLVQCEGDPLRDALLFSGDRAFRITGFHDAALNSFGGDGLDGEPEPLQVICYRVRAEQERG